MINISAEKLNQDRPGARLPELEQKAGKTIGAEKIIHDLRSSLNVITGYSELMLDGVMGEITEDQRVSIKDILDKSRRMTDLINDLILQ